MDLIEARMLCGEHAHELFAVGTVSGNFFDFAKVSSAGFFTFLLCYCAAIIEVEFDKEGREDMLGLMRRGP